MCVQSIPISKKMGDLPGCRENLIPKLLTERTAKERGTRCLTEFLTKNSGNVIRMISMKTSANIICRYL